jgi:hypothetical protein
LINSNHPTTTTSVMIHPGLTQNGTRIIRFGSATSLVGKSRHFDTPLVTQCGHDCLHACTMLLTPIRQHNTVLFGTRDSPINPHIGHGFITPPPSKAHVLKAYLKWRVGSLLLYHSKDIHSHHASGFTKNCKFCGKKEATRDKQCCCFMCVCVCVCVCAWCMGQGYASTSSPPDISTKKSMPRSKIGAPNEGGPAPNPRPVCQPPFAPPCSSQHANQHATKPPFTLPWWLP